MLCCQFKNQHNVTRACNKLFHFIGKQRPPPPYILKKNLYGSGRFTRSVLPRQNPRHLADPLKILIPEHVTNEEVFNRANTKPTLVDGLLKRRLAFHGHLVWKGGITLDLMIGRLHGTRPRGRPITTWLKDLTTQANISYKESMTLPRDRKKWRSVGNPRRTPDE